MIADLVLCVKYSHHFCEASHIEHIVDLGIHVRNPEIFIALCQHQQDAEAGTRDILQRSGIYGELSDCTSRAQQLFYVTVGLC